MLRRILKGFWRFMVLFSFVVNLVLVVVLLVLGVLIFEIKNQVAEPLVGGLYSSFAGLDQATIDTTIPVRDRIPVVLNIPLKTDTTVVLTDPVPLRVNAIIDLPGLNASNVPATVSLTLPRGLNLPVALDLNVPVEEELDVALDVRAVIPLRDTQLHDAFVNLQLLFDPIVRALWSPQLPDNFGEIPDLVSTVLSGESINLLEVPPDDPNHLINNPWPGFSQTAGVGYDLFTEPIPPDHVRLQTGIVPQGGMPFLDEQIRPEIWAQGGPEAINDSARQQLQQQVVPAQTYDGGMAAFFEAVQNGLTAGAELAVPGSAQPGAALNVGQDALPTTDPSDFDIVQPGN
jgi:hypothetical protein